VLRAPTIPVVGDRLLAPKLKRLIEEGHRLRGAERHDNRSDVDRWVSKAWGTLARYDRAQSFGEPLLPTEDQDLPGFFVQRLVRLSAIRDEQEAMDELEADY
jgi:hypothetical protein